MIKEYAMRYLELNSMMFDLYPFIPFLSYHRREEIVQEIEKERVEQEESSDNKRKARVEISIFKMKKVFGMYEGLSLEGVKE